MVWRFVNHWRDNSIKIVIHICDAKGHGTSFKCNSLYTNFYYKIPWFGDKKNEKEEEEVYNEIQELQDMQFRVLVREAAQKDLIFFCLNYHRKSLYTVLNK